MKQVPKIICAFIIAAIFFSCQKRLPKEEVLTTKENMLKIPGNFFKDAPVPGVVQKPVKTTGTVNTPDANSPSLSRMMPSATPMDPDNGDTAIVLGNRLPNPYTVANMQQAYTMLYGRGVTLVANYKYVKFKPANADQLEMLQDSSNLELQDYPMDYEVLQDGDYYQDPASGTEEIGWLYAVVPVGYTAPPGIEYQILSALYIPDNNLVLEGMAESIAAGALYVRSTDNEGQSVITRTDVAGSPSYRPVCDPETDPACGQGGDNGGGGPTPTPAPLPPGIYVEDIINCNAVSTTVPLRQARVVCKRWFKIWRGYTDDNGQFNCTKRFRNNVKVIVKTQNNNASIGKVRGARFWQMLFAVKKRIGVFSGSDLPYIRYVFTKPVDANAKNTSLPYWAAATTHNSVIEFKDYSAEFGLPQPKDNLKIFVTNWGFVRASGSTVMFNKCNNNILSPAWIAFFLTKNSYVPNITSLAIALKNRVDMTISYLPGDANYNCNLTSVKLKGIAYHELGHTQHYNQAGCNYWAQLRNAEMAEIINSGLSDPYGDGTNSNTAPIIATAEMWGNHCGYIYTNRHYGNGGAAAGIFTAKMQNINYYNNAVPGLNAYLSAIESFNPTYTPDKWRWIPQGLSYDLIDPSGETTPIIDNVAGYTNQQCFNALQPDVRSIPAFKQKLLIQNGNNQQVQINQLFTQYGY